MSKYVIDDGWRFPFYEIFYMALGGAIVGLCVLAWNISEFELPKFERTQTVEQTKAEEPASEPSEKIAATEQLEKLGDPTPTFSKDEPEPLIAAALEQVPEPRIFHWAYFDGGYNSVYPYEGVTIRVPARKRPRVIEKVATVEKHLPQPEKPQVALAPPMIKKVVIGLAADESSESQVELKAPPEMEAETEPLPSAGAVQAAVEPVVQPEPKAIPAPAPVAAKAPETPTNPKDEAQPVIQRAIASNSEPEVTTVGEDFYTVRVGVFVQEESVAKLVKELKSQGYDAFSKKKFRGGAMRTYIYVGNFKKREEAETFHSGFAQKTGLKSIVTYHTRFNES